MALVRNCSDQKAMRKKVVAAAAKVAAAKPFMLKDYLMDDMSSCSSNGFKSYPRRQCCSTVRFLDRPKNRTKRSASAALKRRRSRAAAAKTMSALQRASAAVFNAVKLLPFQSVKSGASPVATRKSNRKVIFLPRKLLKRSFWKKKMEEPDRRSILFRELLGEKDKPSDETTTSSANSTTTTTSSNSNSFTEVDFSHDTSRSGSQDDVVEGVTDLLPEHKIGVTDGHNSTEAATTNCSEQNAEVWQNHEEKEQFSPVSVLDCPFEDEEEEEESSSQFQCGLARVEGTKQKVIQKIRRLESVAEMEPLDLEKRIALSENEEGPLASPMQDHDHRTSTPTNPKVNADNEGSETEQKLEELLNKVKATMSLPSNDTTKLGADNLLLEFFRERIVEGNALSERESLTLASDWVNGKPREVLLGWEAKEGREMYVRDMEKGGMWRRTTSFHEKEDVAVELEYEVWTSLVNELVIDLL